MLTSVSVILYVLVDTMMHLFKERRKKKKEKGSSAQDSVIWLLFLRQL